VTLIIRFLKKIAKHAKHYSPLRRRKHHQPPDPAYVISHDQHRLVRDHISRHALKVLHGLQDAGFAAYLVGGSVRDLLVGGTPKDFDVATNAKPEKIRKLFRNCRLIGRRFRLAHVYFGPEIIEVATFRANHPEKDHPDARRSATGMLMRDNVYGSLEEDAWRRDFSINALYLNVANFSVVDYTGGMEDLKKRQVRILGDANKRYEEDPVRMLRAIRFAAKLNFTIHPDTAAPIVKLKHLLSHVSPARLFEEILKLFYCGHAVRAFELLREYQLFGLLFPQTEQVLLHHDVVAQRYVTFISSSCRNTDVRVVRNKSLNPAFLFAVLLWPAMQQRIQHYRKMGKKPSVAFERAADDVFLQQNKTIAIQKRFVPMVREIWWMQRMLLSHTKKTEWVLNQPRFRAAYDFLLLRQSVGEKGLDAAVKHWTELQATRH
jgi:poly(A) polymerase